MIVAWGLLLAGPALAGPTTQAALGHSQLVTSVPAAGDVVATSPTEIRLVFSEPIEGAYTKLDLLDPDGRTLAGNIGAVDAADPYSLVALTTKLADGTYTVVWRALSAADGHTTSGLFTFGVGDVAPAPQGGSTADVGALHGGHDAGTALLETESRIAGDFGFLLAFGTPLISLLVLRTPRSVGVAKLIAGSLLVGVIGAAGLLILGAISTGLDLPTYGLESRTGILLMARGAIALVGAAAILAVARRRPFAALPIGVLAAGLGIVLVAAGGHAAAYASPAPVAVIVVHLAAAAIWLSGILSLAWLAIAGRSANVPADVPLSILVPRFSALALVSVGLVVLTGIYSDWIQTRSVVSIDTPYATTLLVKAGLATAAFAIGARNFFAGGRDGVGRFGPRIALESALALGVVVATGVLASGSPPAQQLPIRIAEAQSSVARSGPPVILEVAPGRPGPTRFVVSMPPPGGGSTVELQLLRLDANAQSRITLRPTADPGTFQAGGGLLPAGSRWDASLVVRAADGTESSRTRYSFALDAEGISEGRATPAVDPALAIAIVLLIGAAFGIAFTVGGGTLPRVDPATSRIAVLGGSAASIVIGAAALLGGPRL
jgi:copper transport protein